MLDENCSRRGLLIGGLTAVIAIAAAYAAFAKPGFMDTGLARVSAQGFMQTGRETSTSGPGFVPVSGLSGLELCGADQGVSATVSMELSGGAAEVRIRARTKLLHPSGAIFDPRGGQNSFSFTFARTFSRGLPSSYGVEWRALGVEATTLHRGSLQVLYGSKAQGCG